MSDAPLTLFFPVIDSTNEEAKRLIQQGKVDQFAFITAHAQTAGRGTQGRQWDSPAGAGVYLSVVHLHTEAFPLRLTDKYTIAAGIACLEVLSPLLPEGLMLKPINDLYYRGRKLGGILTESIVQEGQMKALITGVGVNTHFTRREAVQAKAEPISIEEIVMAEKFMRMNWTEITHTLGNNILQWNQHVASGRYDGLINQYILEKG